LIVDLIIPFYYTVQFSGRPPPCHICPHCAVSCCGCSFI
jgi:hypothetical protein